MPNRILKESICASENINSLTYFEEVFFYRLIVNADDYGRMDARPAMLKAKLFPLKSGVTEEQLGKVLNKLSTVGMVQVYEYDQKPFLQLVSWNAHQQIRAKKSKYPAPTSNGNHLQSNDIKCPRNPIQSNTRIQSESECENTTHAPACEETDVGYKISALKEFVKGSIPSDKLKTSILEWLEYKKYDYEAKGIQKLLAIAQKNATDYGETAVCSLIDENISNGYKGITWDRLARKPSGKSKDIDFEGILERYAE